jgi:hypothetical protein
MDMLILKNISPENQARILGFVIAENIPCSASVSVTELREYADQIEAETAWESSDEYWIDSGCSDYDSDWTSSDTSCE